MSILEFFFFFPKIVTLGEVFLVMASITHNAFRPCLPWTAILSETLHGWPVFMLRGSKGPFVDLSYTHLKLTDCQDW